MRRINLLALAAFTGLLVWVFLFDSPTTRNIQTRIMELFSPFTRTGAAAQESLTGEDADQRTVAQVREENQKLQLENDRLHILEQQSGQMRQELDELNTYFRFKKQNEFKLTAARIIVRKNSAWYRQATIDKGENQGIVEGSPVIVPEGLVGRVVKVFADESEILFVTDELCKVAAQIEGTRERGILEGVRVSTRRRPDLRLRFLPRDIGDNLKGRKVYTLSDYISFPPNIPLGTIVDFHAGDYSSEAIVQPAVSNLDGLQYVFVMEPGVEEKSPQPQAPPQ